MELSSEGQMGKTCEVMTVSQVSFSGRPSFTASIATKVLKSLYLSVLEQFHKDRLTKGVT